MLRSLGACVICEAGACDIVCKRCAFCQGCHRAQPSVPTYEDGEDPLVHEYRPNVCKSLLELASCCALPLGDGLAFIHHAKTIWPSLYARNKGLAAIRFFLHHLSYKEMLIVGGRLPETFGRVFCEHAKVIFELGTAEFFVGAADKHRASVAAVWDTLWAFAGTLPGEKNVGYVFWLCATEGFRRLWSVCPDDREGQFRSIERMIEEPRDFMDEKEAIAFYSQVIDAARACLLAYLASGPSPEPNLVIQRVLESDVLIDLFESDQAKTEQYFLSSPYNTSYGRLALFALAAIFHDSSRGLTFMLDRIPETDRRPFLQYCYKIASDHEINMPRLELHEDDVMTFRLNG